MTTRDNLRVEQVYFENLKRTMNELAAKKSELDGTMQTIAENAVAADENIIMLYKNLCEAWIEAENLFKKVDTDTQAITERIDSLEKEFNEKIDEVNNYIVSITRALDERLTQAEDDIDALEGRMDTAEGDIDALETRMTAAETDIANLEAYKVYDTVTNQAVASIPDGEQNGAVVSLVAGIEPVQSGSGDPSPTNVRTITGWTGLTLSHSGADTSNPETVSISWQTEAGTVYKGELDVINGILKVIYKMLSTATWDYVDGSTDIFFANVSDKKYGDLNILSETYKTASSVDISSMQNYTIRGRDNRRNIYIRDTRYDNDLSGFQSYVQNEKILYELSNPITYQLTPTEVRLLLGTNNLWVDTGNILEMNYPCDLKLYIDKKISQITPTNLSATRTEHDFSAAQEVFDALKKTEITDAEEPEEER